MKASRAVGRMRLGVDGAAVATTVGKPKPLCSHLRWRRVRRQIVLCADKGVRLFRSFLGEAARPTSATKACAASDKGVDAMLALFAYKGFRHIEKDGNFEKVFDDTPREGDGQYIAHCFREPWCSPGARTMSAWTWRPQCHEEQDLPSPGQLERAGPSEGGHC